MEDATCNKCGSKMIVMKNSKKAFYPACSTPEKHDAQYVPPKKEKVEVTPKRAIDMW